MAEALAEARARTVLLVSTLGNDEMQQRPGPQIVSVLTILERIVHVEEAALLGDATEAAIESYDEWFDRMMDVRQRVLDRLNFAGAAADPLPDDRYRLVLEHEYHQNEALLQTVQSLGLAYRPPQMRVIPSGRALADPGFMVRFAGGSVEIGQSAGKPGWSEERPRHRIELDPFWIDMMPVTNADYITFIAAGGYLRRELWSEPGWAWREEYDFLMPANWTDADGIWRTRWMGREILLDPSCPVSHVSQYEAEAFAAFVGKRLPSEQEWETAACWDPETQGRRSYPWGNMPPSPHVANLDQFAFEPAPVGAYPGNVSPLGCYGMIGDAWEWTSSAFLPYPEWSDDPFSSPFARSFRGEDRVLRGGSWATRPGAIRVTSRRPAAPEARHLFAGFRCARSA
jgi:gamma-glutamyl hercynylcysteine S-oxide synthase